MVLNNQHRHNPAIIEARVALIVSEHQLTDELKEVGDDLEEEIDQFGSSAHPSDHASLDPNLRMDPRELASNSWNSQKDRQLDL